MSFAMIMQNQNTEKNVLYGYRQFIVYIKTDYFYQDIVEDV